MNDDRYFDCAASLPPYPEALSRFEEVSLQHYANPSSTHELGRRAREFLENTRKDFLTRLGFPGGALVLTSGATEANNLVLRAVMESNPEGRLLLANDVHPSAWFAKSLYPRRTDLVEIGPDGRLSADRVESRLTKKTVLCSILHGNNETGVVHDVKAIAAACARKGVPLHCDGVQALGRIPISLSELSCAYYTFSAHKFGGPRGIGGVVVRGAPLRPQMEGGGQEGGARGGTENVAGLAAALAALEKGLRSLDREAPRLKRLARMLRDEISAGVPDAIVNSDPDSGLPGLLSFSFPGLIGENLVTEMNLRGFAVSAGSACGSGKMEPSRPVMAMGRSRGQALGTVRISMGHLNTEDSVRALAATLKDVVERQRALS